MKLFPDIADRSLDIAEWRKLYIKLGILFQRVIHKISFISIRIHKDSERVLTGEHGCIIAESGDCKFQSCSGRRMKYQCISFFKIHLCPDTFCHRCFISAGRKFSIINPGIRHQFCHGLVKPADYCLFAADRISLIQPVIRCCIAGRRLHLCPRPDQLYLFFIEPGKCSVPGAVRLYCLIHLALDLHVRHAEDRRHKEYCQNNAYPCHPALSLPLFRRYFYQIKIMFHSRTPPRSVSRPSCTRSTRSTPEASCSLWVIIRIVCW